MCVCVRIYILVKFTRTWTSRPRNDNYSSKQIFPNLHSDTQTNVACVCVNSFINYTHDYATSFCSSFSGPWTVRSAFCIYVYIYIYVCVCVHIYIYIYQYRIILFLSFRHRCVRYLKLNIYSTVRSVRFGCLFVCRFE